MELNKYFYSYQIIYLQWYPYFYLSIECKNFCDICSKLAHNIFENTFLLMMVVLVALVFCVTLVTSHFTISSFYKWWKVHSLYQAHVVMQLHWLSKMTDINQCEIRRHFYPSDILWCQDLRYHFFFRDGISLFILTAECSYKSGYVLIFSNSMHLYM